MSLHKYFVLFIKKNKYLFAKCEEIFFYTL